MWPTKARRSTYCAIESMAVAMLTTRVQCYVLHSNGLAKWSVNDNLLMDLLSFW